MRSRCLSRPILRPIFALTAAALLAGWAAGPASSAARPAPVAHEMPAPGHGALDPVIRLAAQRLLVADEVAAAKFADGRPVADPDRERQVLATVTAEARRLGADPGQVERFFRDQFAAARLVERTLLVRWRADPAQAPAAAVEPTAPRHELDDLDDRLVHAFADTAAVRADRLCALRAGLETTQVDAELRLDPTHRAALVRALAGVCG
jgi:chorismate mutase